MRGRALGPTLFLLLLTGVLWAQPRTVAVVDFLPMTPGANPGLSSVLADSIGVQLVAAGYQLVDKAKVRAATARWSDPAQSTLDSSQLLTLARSLGADAVLTGFYGVEGRLLTVGARAFDVVSGRLAVSSLQDGESGLAVLDTIDAIAASVVERVRENLPALAPSEVVVNKESITVQTQEVQEVVELGTLGTVTLTSPIEGAEVYAGETLLGRIENGRLAAKLKVGARLLLTQRLAGWYEATTTLAKVDDGATFALPELYRIGTWEADALFLFFQPNGLRLGAVAHGIPDTVAFELSAGGWLLTTNDPAAVGTHMPFLRGDLVVTYRFFPPTWPFRMAVGAGIAAGATVVTPVPLRFQLAPEVVLRAEYNAPRWRLYGELGQLTTSSLWSETFHTTTWLQAYVSGGLAWKF